MNIAIMTNNSPLTLGQSCLSISPIFLVIVIVLSYCLLHRVASANEDEVTRKEDPLVAWVEDKISPTRSWVEKQLETVEAWVRLRVRRMYPQDNDASAKPQDVSFEADSSRHKGLLSRVNKEEFEHAMEKVKARYDGVVLSARRLDLETVKYRFKILLKSGEIQTVSVEGQDAPDLSVEDDGALVQTSQGK